VLTKTKDRELKNRRKQIQKLHLFGALKQKRKEKEVNDDEITKVVLEVIK
jgi:hypothetical protein